MRLTIDPKPLRDWLSSAPARGRSTLPVLSHVLLRADADGLCVEATDLTVWEWRRLEAEVQTPGAVCAQHTLLSAALGGATGAVTLDWCEGDPHLSVIVAGSGKRASRFKVPVLAAGDFPSESDQGEPEPLALEREQLAAIIDDLAFAVPRYDVRFYLMSLALCPGMAVATDGHRMALWPMDLRLAHNRELLLPVAALEALRRMLKLPEVTLSVLRSGDQPLALVAHSPVARLRLALVDGRYPANIASFLPTPKPEDFVLEIDTELLREACERLKGYSLRRSSDKSTWSPVAWQFGDGELVARTSGGEAGGEAEIFLPVRCVQGQAAPDTRWAAELAYVAEPLRRAPEQVRLRWVEGMSADRPLVIEAGDIFHTIMPLRM